MWWDVSQIQTTVTRQFVCSHLHPEDAGRLDRPVGFGGGLTDGTYWEWIDGKAKRIFLVLLDLGVPEHIFSIIDDSWDDSDLPIALDQVRRLGLTGPARDERRFYNRQFHYLLRPLRKGQHVVYSESEVVPLDVVDGGQVADRVTLPGFPDHVFCRRRIPIGSGPGCLAHEDFQDEADRARGLYNEHLVSYFASYVHRGWGYVLFTPASDASLKTVLAGTTPPSLKALDKGTRRELVMNWIHCLVDTLCYIHGRGLSHGSVRPSRVLLGSGNHISFSDLTRFGAELLAAGASSDQARGGFDKEAYDYAAPEQWFRPSSSLGPGGAAVRRGTLTSTLTAGSGSGSGAADAFDAPESFSISRSWPQGSSSSIGSPTATTLQQQQAPTPHLDPQAADVFSLGCVILELLGFLLKRPTRAFAAHRAAKHKLAGRGGAVLDSSFHRNLGQVETWMTALGREAARGSSSSKDARVLRGVAPMLRVVERMLALHPSDRPSVHDVQARMYCVLTEACGIGEPHCVHAPYRAYSIGGGLKMAAMRAPGGEAGGDDSDDAISIAISKRNSGGSGSGSGRLSSRSPEGLCDGQQQEASWVASPPSPQPQPLGLAGGLLAIRNLQIRDKVRSRSTWQAPPPFAANVSV
ncbi:hypothetical protein RB595_004584 [Gaeumannomyces hyphopodioides]